MINIPKQDIIVLLDLRHEYKGYITLVDDNGGYKVVLPNKVSRKLRIQTISPINWAEFKDELKQNQEVMYVP